MDVQQVPGQKPESHIWYGEDGYYYHRKPRSVGKHTYYCIWRGKFKCGAKAHSRLDGTLFELDEESVHSGHEKALQYHVTIQMEKDITAKCLADMSLELAPTIDEFCRQ